MRLRLAVDRRRARGGPGLGPRPIVPLERHARPVGGLHRPDDGGPRPPFRRPRDAGARARRGCPPRPARSRQGGPHDIETADDRSDTQRGWPLAPASGHSGIGGLACGRTPVLGARSGLPDRVGRRVGAHRAAAFGPPSAEPGWRRVRLRGRADDGRAVAVRKRRIGGVRSAETRQVFGREPAVAGLPRAERPGGASLDRRLQLRGRDPVSRSNRTALTRDRGFQPALKTLLTNSWAE